MKNNNPEKFSGKYKAVKLHLTQHFFLTYLTMLDHGPYLYVFVCLFVLLFLGKHCFNHSMFSGYPSVSVKEVSISLKHSLGRILQC